MVVPKYNSVGRKSAYTVKLKAGKVKVEKIAFVAVEKGASKWPV